MANVLKQIEGHHVGYIHDESPDTPHQATMVAIDENSIFLEIPLLHGVNDEYEAWFRGDEPPFRALLFRNGSHSLHLSGVNHRGYRVNFGSLSHGTIGFNRLVRTGAIAPDYTEIHGLRTELTGLPAWLNLRVVSQKFETDQNHMTAVEFRAERGESLEIPDVPGLTLSPRFETRHDYRNGEHVMRETAALETRYADAQSWAHHEKVHRTLQDLIAIAYWHPCELSVEHVLRLEDEIVTLDGTKHGIEWRPAFTPAFGRRVRGVDVRPISRSRFALFTFADIKIAGLAKWFAEFEDLSRSFGVLSASLYREGDTVETLLLQVAVALEALGYHLATSRAEKEANFVPTIVRIANETDCDLTKVFKGFGNATDWAKAFNMAYIGVKHADSKATAAQDAYYRAMEGVLLARLWLARHLGMSKSDLEDRQHAYYAG